MPTATVYIVLVSVIGPALIKMGLVPMGAHLFLFYFGLISMLTPPVAIASMVAAEMAGADMWKTGFIGVQLAATAYLLPYLWAFNPALMLEGNDGCDHLCDHTAVSGASCWPTRSRFWDREDVGWLSAIGMYVAALTVGLVDDLAWR